MVFMQGLWGEAVWNRPDGATTQEVYNMARQIQMYLIIKQEVSGWRQGQGQKPSSRWRQMFGEGAQTERQIGTSKISNH